MSRRQITKIETTVIGEILKYAKIQKDPKVGDKIITDTINYCKENFNLNIDEIKVHG